MLFPGESDKEVEKGPGAIWGREVGFAGEDHPKRKQKRTAARLAVLGKRNLGA